MGRKIEFYAPDSVPEWANRLREHIGESLPCERVMVTFGGDLPTSPASRLARLAQRMFRQDAFAQLAQRYREAFHEPLSDFHPKVNIRDVLYYPPQVCVRFSGTVTPHKSFLHLAQLAIQACSVFIGVEAAGITADTDVANSSGIPSSICQRQPETKPALTSLAHEIGHVDCLVPGRNLRV